METWRRSALEHLRGEFALLARSFGTVELRVFINDRRTYDINDSQGTGPDISVEDGLGGGRKTFHFWATERSPHAYWFCSFEGGEHQSGAGLAFTRLSKQAGALVRPLPFADSLGTDPRIRDDDLWTVLLFVLAWQELPDCPLRAWCDQVDEAGYRGTAAPKCLADVPMGIRSQLAIDPFAASAYALGILLDETTPREIKKKAPRGRRPEYDPAKDSRIWDAWASKSYRKHADLAKELGLTEKQVKDALDRQRHRR